MRGLNLRDFTRGISIEEFFIRDLNFLQEVVHPWLGSKCKEFLLAYWAACSIKIRPMVLLLFSKNFFGVIDAICVSFNLSPNFSHHKTPRHFSLLKAQKTTDWGFEKYASKNPLAGEVIKKSEIPKELDVDNLFKLRLSGFWRMLYTIRRESIEIFCFILVIESHPDYNKRFGKRKKNFR